MANPPPFPHRRASAGLILGALMTLPIAYLFLQTHGPYGNSLERIVWHLDHHDYSRWAVFPAILILPGIRKFHRSNQADYGSLGLWGYRLSFAGLSLAALGQVWDYILFDPWVHPLHGVGFMAQLLAMLLMVIGLPVWAFANFRALSGWRIFIPALWILYAAGLLIDIFISDGAALYPRYRIDGGFIFDAVINTAYILMGFTLWSAEEKTDP